MTDRRIRKVGEILTSIKAIKLNCWEKPFSTLINTVRRSVPENQLLHLCVRADVIVCHYVYALTSSFVNDKFSPFPGWRYWCQCVCM